MFKKDEFKQKGKEYLKLLKKDSNESFKLLEGSGKIMLSSPHSSQHQRKDEILPCELGAGVMANILHDDLNCPIIYKCKKDLDDPNYDLDSQYKNKLVEYINKNNISLLIDLHQLSNKREVLINLGTGNHKNLNREDIIEDFKETFKNYNFKIDEPFSGERAITVSSHIASNCHIQTLQLEINSKISNFDKNIDEEFELYKLLTTLIIRINLRLENEELFKQIAKKYPNVFSSCLHISGACQNFNDADRDHMLKIFLPTFYQRFLKNDYVFLLNNKNGFRHDAIVKYRDDLDYKDKTLFLSKTLKTKLELKNENNDITILSYQKYIFSKVELSSFETLKNDNEITIYGNNYLKTLIHKYDNFMLYNDSNKMNIIINSKHISYFKSDINKLMLCQKYRTLLNYDFEKYLELDVYEKLNQENQEYFEPKKDLAYLKDNVFVNQTSLRNDLLKQSPLVLIPLIKEKRKNLEFKALIKKTCYKIGHFFTNILVGKRATNLKVIRPVYSDESEAVVRMSETNMKLLGIHETEKAVITYKNEYHVCRVLPIDNCEELKKQNKPFDEEIVITIPSFLRNELNVDIYDCVKIERDTSYIFFTELSNHITEYLVSLLFSTNFKDIFDLKIDINISNILRFILLVVVVTIFCFLARKQEVK